ncbi:MAG: hypothetical protein C4297_09130 [Gemmataceae bacterium]
MLSLLKFGWRIRSNSRNCRQRTRRHYQLSLESLEERLAPAVYWVSPTGNDNNLGGETTPVFTVRRALQIAEQFGDRNPEIRMLPGRYFYNYGSDMSAYSTKFDSITLLGGYNSSSRSEVSFSSSYSNTWSWNVKTQSESRV